MPATETPRYESCTCTRRDAFVCGHCWHDSCCDCGACAGPGCTCHCELGFTPADQYNDCPTAAPAPASPIFYLGAHHAPWLATAGVPLCVSHRTLRHRRSLPRAATEWVLDSGGFTELSLHGAWTVPARQYAAAVRRYTDEIGQLVWAAPQDWMCEPWMLEKTGLTLREHQERSVASYLELKALDPTLPFIPVLQGWELRDYETCVRLFERAGVDLAACPTVGVGSVCRRQATGEAAAILAHLASGGLRLHGFGLKLGGLAKAADHLASADSLAWSMDARRSAPMDGHTHKSCANCQPYALTWRQDVIARLDQPRQIALNLDFAA